MQIRGSKDRDYFVHDTAIIDDGVTISKNVKIWAHTHIRTGAIIGENCIIGESVYVGEGVVIGRNCKIQNGALIYEPSVIGDGVFIGPGTIFTNDRTPRAINGDGQIKSKKDWSAEGVEVKSGASIGAGVVCVAPLVIGNFSLVGAGSTVIDNVSDFETVAGNPARHLKFNCKCGLPLATKDPETWYCETCGFQLTRIANESV